MNRFVSVLALTVILLGAMAPAARATEMAGVDGGRYRVETIRSAPQQRPSLLRVGAVSICETA